VWARVVQFLLLLAIFACGRSWAQVPSFSAPQLDRVVGRIAVFSDPLLAQVLAAVSFSDEIPGAAQWADQHRDLSGQSLAEAMRSDQLRFNPSVLALLPFSALLDSMAADMNWTAEMGAAVLAAQRETLNAVQRQRGAFCHLRTDGHVIVDSASHITIMPRKLAYVVVPSYDPDIVFSAPMPGANVADVISYSPAVNIGGFQPFGWKAKRWETFGSYFQPWGWGSAGIDWEARSLVINGVAWGRTWGNRYDYVHAYPDLGQVAPAQ
jgi:Protein of unknown function (DUF3300)